MESTNHTRHNYLETVLSPLTPPTSYPLVDPVQAPQLIDSVPVPLPTSESQLPLGQPRYRTFEMNHEKNQFPVISHNSPNGMFCIDCNNCGRSIANEHYHCSICENGDYDLCLQCVGAGTTCRGEGHWLIKRTVQDGVVTNSTTETIPPRDPSVMEFKPLLTTHVQREVIAKPVVHVPDSVQEPVKESIPAPVASSPGLDTTVQGDDRPVCNGCCRGKLPLLPLSLFPLLMVYRSG